MSQYISKSALLAELNIKKIPFKRDIEDGNYPTYLCAIMDFEDLINTLETKEVDLEKEIDKWYNTKASKEFENVLYEDIEKCAKHFFELGLIKAWKGE